MIRQGLLCNHCTDKQCKDLGTDQEPIEFECPSCDGGGCDECNIGSVRLSGCPSLYCGSVATAVGLIELFERGLPPVAGGTLDQSVSFIEASRILRSDEAKLRNEMRGH